MNLFKRGYNQIIYLTGVSLTLITLGIEYFQYEHQKGYVLIDLKNHLDGYASTLNVQARTIKEYVNGLKIAAENNLIYIQNFHISSPLFTFLRNNTQNTGFYFDIRRANLDKGMIGNLTGMGSLENLSKKVKDEINMALLLNTFFEVILKNNSGSVWVYYTSKNNFQNLYPWTPPTSNIYHKAIQGKDFFRKATPENNPRRENFWTSAYQDGESYEQAYQRGIVVTNTSPVYNAHEFLGSLSLDISLEKLNQILKDFDPLKGTLFLINQEGQLLATTHVPTSPPKAGQMLTIQDQVPPDIYDRIQAGMNEPYGAFSFGDPSLVYVKGMKDAPWYLVYIAAQSDLFTQAFWEAVEDIFIILIMLLFVVGMGYILVIRNFISPAQKLVNHITNENEGLKSIPQNVPSLWKPWFRIVSRIFDENRLLMANLEDQVTIRTKQLARKNQQLEKTLKNLKMAQNQIITLEKLASLGALTAGIAHEIKNPLNFVINFTDISLEYLSDLKKKVPNDEGLLVQVENNLMRTKEHAERADSIVKGMLAHARGGLETLTSFNLNELMDEALVLASFGFQGQEAHFSAKMTKTFDLKIKSIKGYQQDLVRVFLNIINNAYFAMQEKKKKLGQSYHPHLKVQTRDEKGRVKIIIEDNGPGISKAHLKKIFNPFFTTKEAGLGTGLGLSLSYDIITQQHHGHLFAESKLGTYSRFIIELPKDGRRSDE